MPDLALGRRPSFDERSRLYPVRAVLPARAPRSRVLWNRGEQLDQNPKPACTGFSAVTEALASPVRVDLRRTEWSTWSAYDLAMMVYLEAQKIDEWPGEDYDGSSVIAAVKIMVRLGFYTGYRWGFGGDDLRDTLLGHGPAPIGIPWRGDMFSPDSAGRIHATGQVEGGHAICANGYRPVPAQNHGDVHLQNTWGRWGVDGGCWIDEFELRGLLADDGEVCVPVGRSYNRTP